MTIETVLTLPPSADRKFPKFGRQVIGVDPGRLSLSESVEIQHLLYKIPYLVPKCALEFSISFYPFSV